MHWLSRPVWKYRSTIVTRENAVKKYIDNPNDEKLYHNALNAFNFGFWLPGQLFDLLTDAYAAGQEEAILNQKIALINIGAFSSGYPPTSVIGNPYMTRYNRDLSLARTLSIHYLIEENITPSEALDSCFNEFMIADSGIIVSLVIAKTLKHYWGAKRYNKYFNTEWKDQFQITSDGVNEPHKTPCCDTDGEESRSDAESTRL